MSKTVEVKGAPQPNFPARSPSEWAAYEQGKKDLMSVLMNTRTDEISPDWGSIHENTATKKLHPPLVKLGQGDYEKNYPKSDDGPGDVW